MAQTEDVPYTAPDFVTPDDEREEDPEQPNKGVLVETQKYLDEAIAEHNTLDVVDLMEQAHMSPTQQIAVHKLVVQHLRNIKAVIDDKVKELR